MAYDYKRDKRNGALASMTRSRSKINTFHGSADGDYAPSEKWLFAAGVSVHEHLVESADKNIISQEGNKAVVGYDKGRVDVYKRQGHGRRSGTHVQVHAVRTRRIHRLLYLSLIHI